MLWLLLLVILVFVETFSRSCELASGCEKLSCELKDLLVQTGSDMCEFRQDVCGSDSI